MYDRDCKGAVEKFYIAQICAWVVLNPCLWFLLMFLLTNKIAQCPVDFSPAEVMVISLMAM